LFNPLNKDVHHLKDQIQQGQRKAWRIPSPKKIDPVILILTLKINRVADSLKD
jgi:hypothetical protein